ncbi:cobyrinate a,c-diamide synthase [Butyrivibrio sp. YAB3001]|uniref:cobyrinate a,c-diamide synthase n=1 Tax=Butyrivibrio sp. YAB3001 TaxID=1520812 RepID=UPI0008F630D0|nr:cobyrinate a,c-diamide synthase [Butyrivibrio sp. YAB3001]SFC55082.1 cobyrinic acid a,c-diamide synthase [Butyrivibrio sp. YAB3001]
MVETKEFPRFMICAPASGSGKTLITCALLRILTRHGYLPASFKCGPDYIDPMFHRKVLGIPSRNLDLFFMEEKGLRKTLGRGSDGRNIGVLEGVMGIFDGISADSSKGSSIDISKITGTPAILVVNCKGMSRSVIPLVKGFCDYDRDKQIHGVILNNISPMVSGSIKKEIEEETGIPVIGFLPAMKDVDFGSRHLGLIMPDEVPKLLETIDQVADKLEENLELDKLISIAKEADRIGVCDKPKLSEKRVKVGVAIDEAFCFYYEDNFDLLKEMGADIVPFSPIHDTKLPEVSRLIIGGGYPELHAKELSENLSMRKEILNAAKNGMPILAECGGFLYLQEKLSDQAGISYEMVGALKGQGYMTGRLGHFGYVTMEAGKHGKYLDIAESVKAHEFHYYDTTDNGDVCILRKPSGKSWSGYQMIGNVFGGFAHLYYPSCPKLIRRFLEC